MNSELRRISLDGSVQFNRRQVTPELFNKQLTQEEWLNISISILQLPPANRNAHDIKVLTRATQSIKFFEKLKDELGKTGLTMCLKALQLQRYQEGDTIFRQGGSGDKFFIILNGSVGVFVRDRSLMNGIEKIREIAQRIKEQELLHIYSRSPQIQVNTLHSGQTFGELALLNDAPRMATVKALTASTMAVLNRQEYKQILSEVHNRHLEKQIHDLSSIPSLQTLSRQGMQMLLYTFSQITWKYGQYVYHEGDTNDDLLYMITEGEFKIVKTIPEEQSEQEDETMVLYRQQPRTRKIQLCIIGKDSLFGEQESFEELKTREFSVQCVSLIGKTYVVPLAELKKRTAISNEFHVVEFIQELNKRKSRWRNLMQLKIQEVYKRCMPSPLKRRRNSSYELGLGRASTPISDRHTMERKTLSLSDNAFLTQQENNLMNYQSRSSFNNFVNNLLHFNGDPRITQTPSVKNRVVSVQQTVRAAKTSAFKEVKQAEAQTQQSPLVVRTNPTRSQARKQLLPQEMRLLHEGIPKPVSVQRQRPLQPYIERLKHQRIRSVKIQNLEEGETSIIIPRIQNTRNNQYRISPQPIRQTISENEKTITVFEQADKTQTPSIEVGAERTNRSDKITSRVSPNPKASQLPKCRDLQERFRTKNVNNDIDSSLIVESRVSVMGRVVQQRSKGASLSDVTRILEKQSIVMVPCGMKHLRARNWPIKADLFVMKMQDPPVEEKSFADMPRREDYFVSHLMSRESENGRLVRRVQERAFKYVPTYIEKQNMNLSLCEYNCFINVSRIKG